LNVLEPADLGVNALSSADLNENEYVAALYSIGYESRATHIAMKLDGACPIVGFTFPTQRLLSFRENLNWAHEHGSVVEVPEEANYRSLLRMEVTNALEHWRPRRKSELPRFLVDISSMTRQRIADTFHTLHIELTRAVLVDWYYSPATLDGSLRGAQAAVITNGAIRGYEGWGDPSLPAACIVGAGFEGDVALGVIDDIEPEDVWAFVPKGYSSGHDAEIESINDALLTSIDSGKVLEYRVDQPLETLLRLDALVGSQITSRRTVLIPLGPKIFALLCITIASVAPDNVTIWRVSAEASGDASDRKATGDLVGLTVTSYGQKSGASSN
jgi:hypothetical protein